MVVIVRKRLTIAKNITCLDKGICRSIFLRYEYTYLSGINSGPNCEYAAKYIVIRRYTPITFASVGIVVMYSVVIFITVLDALKYVFYMDIACQKHEGILQKRKAVISKDPHVALHFSLAYVFEILLFRSF